MISFDFNVPISPCNALIESNTNDFNPIDFIRSFKCNAILKDFPIPVK